MRNYDIRICLTIYTNPANTTLISEEEIRISIQSMFHKFYNLYTENYTQTDVIFGRIVRFISFLLSTRFLKQNMYIMYLYKLQDSV